MQWWILLCLLAVVHGEFPTKEFVEAIKPVVTKCEASTGVDKRLVDDFNKGTMVDDEGLKCYMKCIFLEFQVNTVREKKTALFEVRFSDFVEPTETITWRWKNVCHECSRFCELMDDRPSKLDETTGYFRYEKMLSMIPQEMKSIAYEMGRNCIHFKGEGGANLCQVSYDLHRCWQKADPEHYFLM